MLYYLLKLARVIASSLPAFITYSLAGAAGNAAYYLWPRGRRNMAKSIAAVLRQDVNSPEVRRNARDGIGNYYKYIVDVLRYANVTKEVLERDIDLIGTENMDRALSAGKGAIVVSFHIGNLDLGIRALSNAGYPINAIVQNLESGQVDRFIQRPRAHFGVKLISAADGILGMRNILKRNEVIALMVDGSVYEKGVLVNLGNKKMMVPSGVAAMALRTGAKVVPCGLVRAANTRFVGLVCKPVLFSPTGDLVEDARVLTQRTIEVLEGMARIFPDQWFIFHELIRDD